MADVAMTCESNFDSLLNQLEAKELERNDVTVSDYERLLAVYLAANDTLNAKFLWKRIPQAIKDSSNDIKAVWQIGKDLIKADYSTVYGLIDSYSWPSHLTEIMDHLRKEFRRRSIQLINKSYSTISFLDAMEMTGCSSEEEVKILGEQCNWQVDSSFGFIVPRKTSYDEDNCLGSNQEQLEKLTEYVSFLENY